jgi:hypothetical protein
MNHYLTASPCVLHWHTQTQIKAVVSGGAPLAPHVEEFLRVAFCAPMVQVRSCCVIGPPACISSLLYCSASLIAQATCDQ